MQRKLERDSLIRAISVECGDGRRIGFVVEEIQRERVRPKHLLNRVLVNNRLLLLVRADLQLLCIAELVVVRHVVDDEDALVHKVFEFLLALADPHDVVHRIGRDFRMGIRKRPAMPAAAAEVAVAPNVWLILFVQVLPGRVHFLEQPGRKRIDLLGAVGHRKERLHVEVSRPDVFFVEVHDIGAADRYAGQRQDVLLECQIGNMVPILTPLLLGVGALDLEHVPRPRRGSAFEHVAFGEKAIGQKGRLKDGIRAVRPSGGGFRPPLRRRSRTPEPHRETAAAHTLRPRCPAPAGASQIRSA